MGTNDRAAKKIGTGGRGAHEARSPQRRRTADKAYDYIVVGAGSAGCVAANRLVADHGASVLLLEAGVSNDDMLIRMPAGTFKIMFGKGNFLTRYMSDPQPRLGGRRIPLAQANVVGGGSSVNVMAYTRGSRQDYDDWTTAVGGELSWGYDALLPYFRRQEGNRRFDNADHGGDGPFKVGDPAATAKASDIFVRTLQRLGLPYRTDFCGGELRGVGYLQATIDRGQRCSAADAFLTPIADDPKLTLKTGARVTRILFEGQRAVGVEYRQGGVLHEARAREVILASGALATPKLLMLSGVGAARELTDHGIPVIADLPGVGQNLQDHHLVVVTATTNGRFGYFGEDRGLRMIWNALRYFAFKDGPVASNGSEAMAFENLSDPEADPELQFYIVPVLWPSDGRKPTHGVTLMASLLKPRSRGSVQLSSANPEAPIRYDPNWLSDRRDEERLLAGLKFIRKIMAADPMSSIIAEEGVPGPRIQSDEDLRRYIRNTVETNYHPVGTCRMGSDGDAMAVLTPDLRVRGIEGLRVFDASMMPTIISANTNATVMAVADRGVDLMIRGRP